jgi:hypothetical protein
MSYAEVEEGWRCFRRSTEAEREGLSGQLHLVRLKQLWLVVSSALLIRWVQMIDGDMGEGDLQSEVWWVCIAASATVKVGTSWSSCRFLEFV